MSCTLTNQPKQTQLSRGNSVYLPQFAESNVWKDYNSSILPAQGNMSFARSYSEDHCHRKFPCWLCSEALKLRSSFRSMTVCRNTLGLWGSTLQEKEWAGCSVDDPVAPLQLSRTLLLGCFLLTEDKPGPGYAGRSHQIQS